MPCDEYKILWRNSREKMFDCAAANASGSGKDYNCVIRHVVEALKMIFIEILLAFLVIVNRIINVIYTIVRSNFGRVGEIRNQLVTNLYIQSCI